MFSFFAIVQVDVLEKSTILHGPCASEILVLHTIICALTPQGHLHHHHKECGGSKKKRDLDHSR